MKTCNDCIHAPCCHYLMQHEKGYDEYTEQYYDDMEIRCEDFLDKETLADLVDKAPLLKILRNYKRQLGRIKPEIERLEDLGNDLSCAGNWSLGYHKGCIHVMETIIDDIEDMLGVSGENQKIEEK